ncbi:MAG: hypothetical protein JWM90_787 [Thermoleophilia bacterium]|nr:hypothetical protein [Thermoleophilia bacterium]
MTSIPPVVKDLSTAAKLGMFGGATAAGVGLGVGAKVFLPSPEGKKELEAEGVSTVSDLEATATVAPMLFIAGAAVNGGIGKRTATAGVTTSVLGAAAILATVGAGAIVNAKNDDADANLRAIVLAGGAASAGFAVGAMDEIPLHRAKLAGLALVGLAVGGMTIPAAGWAVETAKALDNSYHNRDR